MSLIINFQKYILEEYYRMNISQMSLIVLHPSLDKYKKIDVEDYDNEIRSIIYHNKTHPVE